MILTHFFTTMNIRRILLMLAIVIVATFFSRCEVYPQESSHLVYTNNSTHSIIVMRTDFSTTTGIRELPKSFVLEPNESYTIKGILSPALCSVFSKVIFDNAILVDYSKLSQDECNVMLLENFQQTKPEEFEHVYTYTFTDADYQFALENGTPLEW